MILMDSHDLERSSLPGLFFVFPKKKVYAGLLFDLVTQPKLSLRTACVDAAALLGVPQLGELLGLAPERVVGGVFSSACYIDGAFPSVLYLAAKYAEDCPVQALLANANVGGDTAHRGAVLGAILGARYACMCDACMYHAHTLTHSYIYIYTVMYSRGMEGWPSDYVQGLAECKDIMLEAQTASDTWLQGGVTASADTTPPDTATD